MKKLFIILLVLISFVLTACFETYSNDKISKITFYLTDSPDENISKAEILVKEIKLTSDSTTIYLLNNETIDFLTLAGNLKKLKEISIYEGSVLKNSKIEITLDSTIDIGNKEISVNSTRISIDLDTTDVLSGREYNIIIDLDLGVSLNGNIEFTPFFRTWMVLDSNAAYKDIDGYVYNNKDSEIGQPNRVVAIMEKQDLNKILLLYSTITDKDGYFKFNKIKLDPLKNLEIGVLQSNTNVGLDDNQNVDVSSVLISESSTTLNSNITTINLYIGE
ncbi:MULTISPECIES: DUF4382 domain-containing protein [unclassified Marinitoga]|uniref:DUF4382 domain-containing protein n=1 Tax=unclassified Marinitoga TaxID=2640159 RepID=UPI000640F0A9|nr:MULTISPECIES: DUF4382 domain-containing protein [unclassified Marinitoga]KLO21164.1 hypothetical protein X274_11295 [Marinitoga sp. 1155]NUV00204.1 hypothetical protein [Marinitoga sp. 1154]